MDHPRSTSVETLGDLVAHGYVLNAMCERCGHRADLDTRALIGKLVVQTRHKSPPRMAAHA